MKRSTGKTLALGILVFSHSSCLRFAGIHVRAVELPAETKCISIRKFNALRQHDLHNHRLWGSHPSHPRYFLSMYLNRNQQKMNPSTLYIFLWTILSGGKLMTILMIITLIPFFLHCLCTSASNLNNLIDRFVPKHIILYQVCVKLFLIGTLMYYYFCCTEY